MTLTSGSVAIAAAQERVLRMRLLRATAWLALPGRISVNIVVATLKIKLFPKPKKKVASA